MSNANDAVQTVLDQLVAEGREVGLQVAAYLDGKLVVDARAGAADQATGRLVDGDTLFTVFSATKGITATAVHILADRGVIDYDAPIAHYWPDFAARGKAGITIRHAMTHQAGIPQMPEGVMPKMLCDWDAMCAGIANLAPLWDPGTKAGYHALTYGWILGEVVRRADGRPVARFVAEEICHPLGITDLYLGIPEAVEPRVATLANEVPPVDLPTPPPDALILRAIPEAVGVVGAIWNRADIRRAVIPAAGGILNARSLARHYAMLAGGGALDGVRILTPKRITLASQLQDDSVDAVLGQRVWRGLGYRVGSPDYHPGEQTAAMGSRCTAIGHPGAGGSLGFADPEQRFAFGYTKTMLEARIPERPNSVILVANAVRSALGLAD